MRKKIMLARVAVYGVLALAILGTFSIVWGPTHWDGAYAHAEYQILFTDREGNPLDGITLTVQDDSGRLRFDFPVTNFRVLRSPRSDENGLLTFHHVGRGIEFGGTFWEPFFLFRIELSPPLPVFHCRFIRDGEDIHSIAYDELSAEVYKRRDGLPRVKRTREELGLEPHEVDSADLEFPVLRREVVIEAL